MSMSIAAKLGFAQGWIMALVDYKDDPKVTKEDVMKKLQELLTKLEQDQ